MIQCINGPKDGKEIMDTGQAILNLAHFEDGKDSTKGSKLYSCLYQINPSRSIARFLSWKLVGTLKKDLS